MGEKSRGIYALEFGRRDVEDWSIVKWSVERGEFGSLDFQVQSMNFDLMFP